MDGYPDWADTGCGCLMALSLAFAAVLTAALLLLRGLAS